MERVSKRLYPTTPIMKRRFGKLSDEGKHAINVAAEQFKAAAQRLRDCKPEDRFDEMTALFDTLHQHFVEVTKHHSV